MMAHGAIGGDTLSSPALQCTRKDMYHHCITEQRRAFWNVASKSSKTTFIEVFARTI